VSTSKYKQRLAKERKAAAIVAAQEAAARRRRLSIAGAIAGAIVLVALIAGVVVLTGDDDSSSNVAASGSTTTAAPGFTYGTAECAPASGPPEPGTLEFPDTGGFQDCLNPASVYTASFETSAGTIDVQLDAANVPGTVNNFVQLVGWGYYDGTKLFRTDPSIGIIQGGAPQTNSASDPGPGFTIDDEGSGFTYQPGQLVMARTQAPDSAGSQFFFTVTDNVSTLDAQGTYVVFGTVTAGLEILQQILASNVEGTDGLGGSPEPAVVINSITIGEASLVDDATTTLPTSTTSSPASSTTVAPS
jgi:peptidyl-prolyl cis-trans isomerase B (cyclophilin B)